MCLSAVYDISGGKERLICEHTTSISLDDGVITITDILGDEITITGVLKSIDLVKNTVMVEIPSISVYNME